MKNNFLIKFDDFSLIGKSIPGKALHTLIVNCDTFFKFFDKNEFSNVYMVPVLKCFDIP